MLKTVSSITNAIGALNFKGTWNASTNTPALTSGVGTKGDYYVVGTAGTTTLDGISNWGVGDWATYNGTVWQRVEGGADLNGVNLSVSGTTNLAGLTASTALALDASKNVISVTNTGSGRNVLGTSPTIATPTLTGNVQMTTGNLVASSGKGINFSATPGTGTSELLNDYEEGTFTPVWNGGAVTVGLSNYTKIGRNIVWVFDITFGASVVVATSTLTLPFACVDNWGAGSINFTDVGANLFVNLDGSTDTLGFRAVANGASVSVATLATKRVVGMAIYNA